jgi:hypothetical protein
LDMTAAYASWSSGSRPGLRPTICTQYYKYNTSYNMVALT